MIYLYGYVPFITIKGALNITTNNGALNITKKVKNINCYN